MRIDLANLIVAQSARSNAAPAPKPGAGFETALKSVSTPAFEPLLSPPGAAKPADAPTNPGPAQALLGPPGYASSARLGSQIDIKI